MLKALVFNDTQGLKTMFKSIAEQGGTKGVNNVDVAELGFKVNTRQLKDAKRNLDDMGEQR
jgi:hypothetical protein